MLQVENYFSLRHFLPELVLVAAVFLLALLDLFEDRDDGAHSSSVLNASFGMAILILVAGFSIFFNPSEYVSRFYLFEGLLARDGLARIYRVLMPLLGAAALFLSMRLRPMPILRALQVAMLLLVVLSLQLVAASTELLAAVVAMALVSLMTAVGISLMEDAGASSKALAFLMRDLGATALTVFGFTWLFGLSGTMDLSAMPDALTWRTAPAPALAVALALTGVGLVLKVAFVFVYSLRGGTRESRAFLPFWIAHVLAALTLLLRVFGGVLDGRVLFL